MHIQPAETALRWGDTPCSEDDARTGGQNREVASPDFVEGLEHVEAVEQLQLRTAFATRKDESAYRREVLCRPYEGSGNTNAFECAEVSLEPALHREDTDRGGYQPRSAIRVVSSAISWPGMAAPRPVLIAARRSPSS